MKRTKPILLGLCPIGKFVFSHEDAMRYKRKLMERFDRWQVGYVHLDGVLPDGMIRDRRTSSRRCATSRSGASTHCSSRTAISAPKGPRR